MAVHDAQLPHTLDVPEGDVARGVADGQDVSLLGPLHGADVVLGIGEVKQLSDRAAGGVPQVDVGAEGNGQEVVHGPVQQGQVVVVDELGSIENSIGSLGDVSGRSLGRRWRLGIAIENFQPIRRVALNKDMS